MSDNIKKEILNKKIDEDQLNKISGGGDAAGNGGCDGNYFLENCRATVEAGSHCGLSHDYCEFMACGYTQPGGCNYLSKVPWGCPEEN